MDTDKVYRIIFIVRGTNGRMNVSNFHTRYQNVSMK